MSLPFNLYPVKHPQLKKRTSAQHNRALQNSTHLHTQRGWTEMHRGAGQLQSPCWQPGPLNEVVDTQLQRNWQPQGRQCTQLGPPDQSWHPRPQAGAAVGPGTVALQHLRCPQPHLHPLHHLSPQQVLCLKESPNTRKEPTVQMTTAAMAEARQQRLWWHKKQWQIRHGATPLTGKVEAGKCQLPEAAQVKETKNLNGCATYWRKLSSYSVIQNQLRNNFIKQNEDSQRHCTTKTMTILQKPKSKNTSI